MSFAFFFPGQGSQSLRMMDGFAGSKAVQDTFNEASDILGVHLWSMLQDDEEAINSTINTQPIMLTAGVAVWRAWQEAGGTNPDVIAGHSLGEYSALVVAGSLSFADALHMVRLRAKAMQDAVPRGLGAMAAILGLADNDVDLACEEAAQGDIVEPANFNAPGQVVIAGETEAVKRAIECAKARGAKRALLLPVSVPSHCSLMQSAAQQLADALSTIKLQTPTIPVLHNVNAQSHTDPEAIRQALVHQLYSPVLWTKITQSIAAQGIILCAECGPGKVLQGLIKRIEPSLSCFALTDSAAIETAKEALLPLNPPNQFA